MAIVSKGKRALFSVVFGSLLLVVTLVGIEVLASYYVPAWPARAINPREPALARTLAPPFRNQPWLADPDNSWGLRDIERTIAKPPGMRRAVFVGDSFVESRFTPLSLPAAVQQRLPAGDRIEAVNLGVAATDPRSYYYRIRDVALDLEPDAVLLFIYAGNDFVNPDNGYTMWPRLVDESPGGAIVGTVMPRTNWLLVNRLDLADFFRSRVKAPQSDEALLFEAVTAPPAERLKKIVSYVKTYHFPDVPEEKLRELLARGDQRFIDIARPQQGPEQEYLLDWMFDTLLSWETSDFEVARNRADAVRLANPGQVDATLSWIEATQRLLRARSIPLVVFLIPMGSVDPQYVEFWKPWPRAYSWNLICDEWAGRLADKLARTDIKFVNLRPALEGIPGTYRKLDGHWTQKGEAIVADRVAAELETLLPGRQARAR